MALDPSYVITVSGKVIRFVNREAEVRTLHELARSGSPLVEFLYGPEGCGKTTLLRYFVDTAPRDYTVLYVDALETSDVSKALRGPQVPEDLIRDLVRELGLPPGTALSLGLSRLLEYVRERTEFRDRYLVILVDDVVRALGLDKVEYYVKYLYELIGKVQEEYRPRTVLVLATTSEDQSRRLVTRHRYAVIRLLWNLSEEATRELVEQLDPGLAPEEVWLLTGGNPGRVLELGLRFRWRVEVWRRYLTHLLTEFLQEVRVRGLTQYLRCVLEDVDTLYEESDPRFLELRNLLEEYNLVLYKRYQTLAGTEVRPDPELGIGEYYAWQVPIYRVLLRELLS